MSQNWLRHFEIRLYDNDGGGISLSDFKVTFDIQKMPNTAFAGSVGNFKIYNLSSFTVNSIMGEEYSHIEVIAGYDGMPQKADATEDEAEVAANNSNYSIIFSGDIRFCITGKDNPTDSWIQLQCIDGWKGHLNAVVSTTIAAGWQWKDVFNVAMRTYESYGITVGQVPEMPDTVFPRGKTIHSNTPKVLNQVAKACNADWWYENNQVMIRPNGTYLSEAVELNSNNGLIGYPQQTMGGGINVRCLINPNIRMGGLVRINQGSIYRTALSNDEIGNGPGRISTINADGDYIVGSIDYRGDTRGQNWYMDLMCIAKGSADLMNNSTINRVGPLIG
ncbi:hypothetical protein I2494_19410 [Budviciaceae bacterium BWR-B9]|uniref:Bacteriophage protein n=1 Tax=Limnobaculum allomyrinae TaxID=2791986 RepID=A0ABS1IVS2_9GAMM|nr:MULTISPECIES: hypothetical protein [Limnobaculum]MBK5145839.1 hypothetical protein [Limnobaculum allomyrinae]MBV7693847.1 hypothetical protein [Limnobaculum sp. M2-1]